MSTSSKALSASRLSLMLTIALCLLLVGLIGGSGFVATRLIAQASDTTHARIDAEVSTSDQARYEELKKYLADNAAGVSQTAALTAGLGSYSQSSIVATLTGYAARSGVTITNFDLDNSASSSATGAAASANAGGNTVNITLNSPVRYDSFIVFLRLIEQGLMPAQVVTGDVTALAGNDGTVNVSQLGIKVAQ